MGTCISARMEKDITKKVKLDYLLHLPEGQEQTEQKRPLILFLHGSGERGNDVQLVRTQGLPRMLDQKKDDFPFITISPQCPAGTSWSEHTDALLALLDEVTATYPVDLNRIYLTGLSLGGFGTWNLAIQTPHRFAAIAPICGGGERAKAHVLKHMPIWVFHGARDMVVPIGSSIQMVTEIEKHGGKPKFTVYSDAEHDSWTEAYADPELYAWFLQHTLTD